MFYLFHVFRSFLPVLNPIGFGAADFVEFFVAAVLFALVLLRRHLVRAAHWFAARPMWAMTVIGVSTIALRLAMLPQAGAPIPGTADDDSYLLLADTLRHLRLANPMHPFYRFFESNFVLQQPHYASIFPLGQGIALALGKALSGSAWAGVLLSEALLCALCYWMLLAWIPPAWALLGGALAIFQLGPLTYWMNSYWGGAVSGIAGCLVFGSLPRLCRSRRVRDAVLLGTGLALELLTRPFEFVFLVAVTGVFFLLPKWRPAWASLPIVVASVLPAISLTLAQNKAVTGSWTTLPYVQSREQYGVPATFTFQPAPVAHRALTQEQRADYETQTRVHAAESRTSFGGRFLDRVAALRFFFFPALLAASPGLVLLLRRRRLILPAAAVLVFLAGAAFYPYFYPHYVAALACVFVLLAAASLRQLPQRAAFAVIGVAVAHFFFWYGVHALGDRQIVAALGPFESADFVNHGDPEGRLPILARLDAAPGAQLVFVRYAPFHPQREWIANAADIDAVKVVWALDLGDEQDRELADYYRDRTVWLAEPDAHPPRLVPYTP